MLVVNIIVSLFGERRKRKISKGYRMAGRLLVMVAAIGLVSGTSAYAEQEDDIEQPPLDYEFTGQCGFEDMRVLMDYCSFDSRVDRPVDDFVGCRAEVIAPVGTGIIPLTGTGSASSRMGGVDYRVGVHSRTEHVASYDVKVTVHAGCIPTEEDGDCAVIGTAVGVIAPLECLQRAKVADISGQRGTMGDPRVGLEAVCEALNSALPSLEQETPAHEAALRALFYCYQPEE